MTDKNFKHIFSFVLLGVTVGFAALCKLLSTDVPYNDLLLGSLITGLTLVIQYWFRKKSPTEPKEGQQ